MYIYNLTKDELIEQNKHIRVWDKLVPGTKLKIPPITEAVELEVSDIEPFVEDYYPSINEIADDNYLKPSEELKEENIILDNDEPISSKIYEEYETLNKSSKETNNKKPLIMQEDEEEDRPNCFSNMRTKPVLNNYYPYYLGIYNAPRYIPYPIIYFPVYYPKKPN